MSNFLHLSIYSPQILIYKGNVSSICVPGTDGKFGILPNHTPIIASLTKGMIQYTDSSQNEHSIESGVIEVKNNKVDILIN